jgi:hypothetical protein
VDKNTVSISTPKGSTVEIKFDCGTGKEFKERRRRRAPAPAAPLHARAHALASTSNLNAAHTSCCRSFPRSAFVQWHSPSLRHEARGVCSARAPCRTRVPGAWSRSRLTAPGRRSRRRRGARKSRTHSVLYTVGFRTPFRIANAFGEYVFLKKSTNLGREETNQTHTSQRPRGRVVGACRVADAVAHADAAAAAVAFCSQIQNKAVVPFVNPRKRQGASQAQAVRPPHPTHTPGSLGAHSRPGGLCNAGREGRDGRGGAGRGPSMVCVA